MDFTFTLDQLPNVAADVLKSIENRVIVFQGEMGVGKTTFIAALCHTIGVVGKTSSPTFSLVNEYETSDNQLVYHFDCYRLNSEAEALDFGIEDYLYSGNFCFIEWPEKIPNLLNMSLTKISIKLLENDVRQLTIENQNSF